MLGIHQRWWTLCGLIDGIGTAQAADLGRCREETDRGADTGTGGPEPLHAGTLVKSLSSSPREIRAHDRGQTFAVGWVGEFNTEFSGKPPRVQSFALAIERAGHGR